MDSLLKYFLFVIPVGFFWLSVINKKKLKKLKFTGRVPDLDAASRNAGLFNAAAIVSLALMAYFVVL